MHSNPVKGGWVESQEQRSWSSYGFDYLNDSSLLSMDTLA